MKNAFLFFLILSIGLTGQEFPLKGKPLEEPSFAEEETQTSFLYISAGLNLLPSTSFGYRKLYGSYGSDISLSGSFFYWDKMMVFPSVHYKQLFFGPERTNYFGLKTGFYPAIMSQRFEDSSFDFGFFTGRLIQRSHGYDFFEFGLNPLCYRPGEKSSHRFSLQPNVCISYGIMF